MTGKRRITLHGKNDRHVPACPCVPVIIAGSIPRPDLAWPRENDRHVPACPRFSGFGARPNPEKRGLDFRSPIRHPPILEIAAYSFKLWANSEEGQKAISYQAEYPTLDSHRPILHFPNMEITASSFKLRANAPEGRKAIAYQASKHFEILAKRNLFCCKELPYPASQSNQPYRQASGKFVCCGDYAVESPLSRLSILTIPV